MFVDEIWERQQQSVLKLAEHTIHYMTEPENERRHQLAKNRKTNSRPFGLLCHSQGAKAVKNVSSQPSQHFLLLTVGQRDLGIWKLKQQ